MNTNFTRFLLIATISLAIGSCAVADPTTQPSTQPVGKLPHIVVDVKNKQVRVECNAVKADYPLEFLAVMSNTNEYESLVRSDAKPSDLHLALLMIGMKPGQPLHYDKEHDKWYPPTGPLVHISFEYDQDGKHIKVPAGKWMLDIESKKTADDFAWVFTGSKFLDQGEYGANATGQLIGVVNNDLSVLDVPALKSRDIESREWKRNVDIMPPADTPVTMVLTPADDVPATQPTEK